jgi:hypothetical protein
MSLQSMKTSTPPLAIIFLKSPKNSHAPAEAENFWPTMRTPDVPRTMCSRGMMHAPSLVAENTSSQGIFSEKQDIFADCTLNKLSSSIVADVPLISHFLCPFESNPGTEKCAMGTFTSARESATACAQALPQTHAATADRRHMFRALNSGVAMVPARFLR